MSILMGQSIGLINSYFHWGAIFTEIKISPPVKY